MTTMTLHIDNPAIIPSLRKVLSALEGVTIAKPERTRTRKTKVADIPNDATISAMQEIENGKDAGEVKLESVDSFIASMM